MEGRVGGRVGVGESSTCVDYARDLARRAKSLESDADSGGRSLHGGHGEPAPGLLELLAGAKRVEALVGHVVTGWLWPVKLVHQLLKRT